MKNGRRPDAHPRRWPTLAAVMTVALVAKSSVLWQLWDHPLLQPLGELDTAYYADLARQLARDGPFGRVDLSFVSPLYVYFLAGVFSAGGGLLAAKALQVLLGSVAVGLLFLTARTWFGHRAAVAAAVLAILTGLFSFYETLILQTAIDPVLVAAALYAVTRSATTGSPGSYAAAGVLLGLLTLNRPNALAYGAAVLLFIAAAAWRRQHLHGTDARVRTGAALLVAGFAIVLVPNAIRNHLVSGHPTLVASHGGLNFYIGNFEGADGTYSPVAGIRPSIEGQATDAARMAESALGRRVSPGDVSGYFSGLAWAWIRDHPGEAVALWARKALIVVNRTNVPLNFSYAYFAQEEASALRLLAVGPWLLFPLGLAGLFWPRLRRHAAGYWTWAAFVPVYGLAVVAFFVSSRYRLPLLVPLCAGAGAAIVAIIDGVRTGRRTTLLAPAAAILALGVVTSWPLGLADGVEGEQTRKAVWLIEQGAFDDARTYIGTLSTRHAHPGVLAFRVGTAYLGAGRYADAADAFRRAAAADGEQPAIDLGLGHALAAAGDASGAVGPLTRAYDAGYRVQESGPMLVQTLARAGRLDEAEQRMAFMPDAAAGDTAEVALDFGTLALEQNSSRLAERWLRLALVRSPRSGEAAEKLGVALLLQGRLDEARSLLERACQMDASRASAHLNLAVVYAELRQVELATREAREALRLDPTEPRAANLLAALSRQSRQP